MDNSKANKYKKIFDKFLKRKNVHEGILHIEDTSGDFSFTHNSDNKNLDSPLYLASITKLFTTACILNLLENNQLSLEDKISKYLDSELIAGIHVYKGTDYSQDLTISNLLFQTSGMPDAFEDGDNSFKGRVLHEDYSMNLTEHIDLVKSIKPRFAPDTNGRAYYADINFDLLGKIIELITEEKLCEVYQEFIFKPLNMQNTYLVVDEEFVPNVYYKDEAIHRPKYIASTGASGGAVSTASDIMIFIKAFFNGVLFDRSIFDLLEQSNGLQASMGPINYKGGFMQIQLSGIFTLFMGQGELIGHTGTTGSFAFYYPHKELYYVGDLNQMADPSLPIRLAMELAMT